MTFPTSDLEFGVWSFPPSDLEFGASVAVKNGKRGISFAVVVSTSIDFGFVCSFLDQNVKTVNRAVNRPLTSK